MKNSESFAISWKTTKEGTDFYHGIEKIGTAISQPGCGDHFVPMGEGVLRWTRTSPEPVDKMDMRFEANYEMLFEMAPAVRYDGNKCTIQDYNDILRQSSLLQDDAPESLCFKTCFDRKNGLPWKLAWWRTSIPGATYTEGKTQSVAMFLPLDQLDAGTSAYPDGGITIQEMFWPLEEGPRTTRHRNWDHGYRESIAPRKVFAVMLVFAPVRQPRMAWHRLVEAAWELDRKVVPPKFSDAELWDMGIAYAKCLYREDEKGFKAMSLGKRWVDGNWVNVPRYELGWCGQSISLANSLMMHAIMTGDKKAEQIAFLTMDSWLAWALPNGILPIHLFEQSITVNGRHLVDSCNLAGGAIQYFQAWDLARALGQNKPGYYEVGCHICDFALEQMNEEGRIGKSWMEDDLTPFEKDGTTGAFLTMALCEGAKRTGRQDYLSGAIKSYDYYNDEFIANGYATGGAQDIFSIDKEAGIPLLKAGLALHGLTGDRRYLENAENAAWYLATWQWHFTREFKEGGILGPIGYNTFGGTSVSIHGAGQDPYALYYVHDFYDLSELTGNPMWGERAHAAWCNGMDGVSDGSLVVNGKLIPYGGQHEARHVGNWGEDNAYEWLVAWPTAFRLENLRRIRMTSGDRKGRTL